jgi:hypothetical protein
MQTHEQIRDAETYDQSSEREDMFAHAIVASGQ